MAISFFENNGGTFVVCRPTKNTTLATFQLTHYINALRAARGSDVYQVDHESVVPALRDGQTIVFCFVNGQIGARFITSDRNSTLFALHWRYDVETNTFRDTANPDQVIPEFDYLDELFEIKQDNPRVTLALIAYLVSDIYFSTPLAGILNSPLLEDEGSLDDLRSMNKLAASGLSLTTCCHVVLKNEMVFTGVSTCISPENYKISLGKKYALEDAVRKLWEPVGYTLAAAKKTPADLLMLLGNKEEQLRQAQTHAGSGNFVSEV